MSRVAVAKCETCGRSQGEKHVATMTTPRRWQLARYAMAAMVPATDGCDVEPDGTCEHGHMSWLLRLGLI